jgi:uncharacterized membrane protein
LRTWRGERVPWIPLENCLYETTGGDRPTISLSISLYMITSTRLLALLRNVGHWDSHVRQVVAVVIAVVTFLLFIHHGRSPITHFIAIWDIYAIVVVLMAWVTICTANPRTIQRKARLQDSSRSLIFAFILVAACISLLAVILVLREHKALQKSGGLHVFMAALAVIESWLLIHTVFTLHYAHVYYRSERETDVEGSGGGLLFPGRENPDYLDFAYFSFVVGMTCQVSDVNITSRSMRRLALLHGLLSFAFNTVILALSINVISGLFVS